MRKKTEDDKDMAGLGEGGCMGNNSLAGVEGRGGMWTKQRMIRT